MLLYHLFQTDNKKSGTVTWRCSSRSKAVRCPVTISQRGDHFVQKREHMPAAVPDQELRHHAYSKVCYPVLMCLSDQVRLTF